MKIYPSGAQAAREGEEITFTILTDRENATPVFIVDGTRQDLQKEGDEYRFTLQVTGNHSVLATSSIAPSVPKTTQVMDEPAMKGMVSASKDGQPWPWFRLRKGRRPFAREISL